MFVISATDPIKDLNVVVYALLKYLTISSAIFTGSIIEFSDVQALIEAFDLIERQITYSSLLYALYFSIILLLS